MKWAVISTWKMSFAGNVRAAEMLSKGCKCGDAIIEGVSMDDILAASAAYDCREEVEEFMSAAKLRGREVILRTMGEVV